MCTKKGKIKNIGSFKSKICIKIVYLINLRDLANTKSFIPL